jgi:hypothetical protein
MIKLNMQLNDNIRNGLNEMLYSLKIYDSFESLEFKYSNRIGHYIFNNIKGSKLKLVINDENNIDDSFEYASYIYIEKNLVMISYIDEREIEYTKKVCCDLYANILFNVIVKIR